MGKNSAIRQYDDHQHENIRPAPTRITVKNERVEPRPSRRFQLRTVYAESAEKATYPQGNFCINASNCARRTIRPYNTSLDETPTKTSYCEVLRVHCVLSVRCKKMLPADKGFNWHPFGLTGWCKLTFPRHPQPSLSSDTGHALSNLRTRFFHQLVETE